MTVRPRIDLEFERARHARHASLDAAVGAQRWCVALLALSAIVVMLLLVSWRAERLGVPPCVADGSCDAPFVCAEDDPCWDCETMGNMVCGPAR